MSSPIGIPKSEKSTRTEEADLDGASSRLSSLGADQGNATGAAPVVGSHEDSLLDSDHPAVQRTIGQSIAAFMRSFSPLSTHEAPSPLLSSSPHRTQSTELKRVGSPSNTEMKPIISFGSPTSRSASPHGSSGILAPNSSQAKDNAAPSGSIHLFGPDTGPEDLVSKSGDGRAVNPSEIPVVITAAPANPLGAGTLLAASSASNLAAATSSGLFSVLGGFFSKREIVGSFDVELGTSMKMSESDFEGWSADACTTDSDGFVSAHFEINKQDLSNVDQIIVQKLMMLFREAQRRQPSSFVLPVIGSVPRGPSASMVGTSAPGLAISPNAVPVTQASYVQTLTSGITGSNVNLNSKMESAIEWTLQARPLGYGYKGIGKLLRKIGIIAKPPGDLHLTHVPLFLHSVPQLEILTLQHHFMSNIPVFTFYISSRLTKVNLSDNKIKALFTEVPRAELVGIINPGTVAAHVPPSPTQSRASDATSSSSSETSAKPESTRKTDLLEHLSSNLSYFAALDAPTVQTLDLSENLIVTIPPFIGHFKHLETLNLAKNQLTSLPNELAALPVLRELVLDHNYVYELPVGLTALQTLSWRANGLKAGMLTLNARNVISSLAHINRLTALDLSFNALDQLPLSLLTLAPTLKKLNLANNAIYTIVASEIAGFTALSELNLASNRLKSVPSEVFTLKLSHLDISDNQLALLPIPLNSLATSLCVLNLSKNQLKHIPLNLPNQSGHLEGIFIKQTDIQQFNRLIKLDLSQNKIFELPDMFEELGSSLLHLDVSNNLLTTIPPSSSKLISLTTLNASNNKIESFPTLGQMRALEFVDLQGNDALEVLPSTTVSLHRLKEFIVAQTKMSRSHTHSTGIWKYDVQPLKPIVDKAFADRVPQLLSLARSATHSLLLSAVHFLCKNPQFHDAILNQSLHYTLLSNAKCVPLDMDYDECFNSGQEKISSLIATRHLAKNLEVRVKLLQERPLIAILSEHVLQQASAKEYQDPEIYDSEGHQLSKSASSAHLDLQAENAEGLMGSEDDVERGSRGSVGSRGSSISSSHSQLGGSGGGGSQTNQSGHFGASQSNWPSQTPRASRKVQLHRLQNKVRVSLAGLCLDIMCYLSWSSELRDAMNETDGLVEAVKKLKSHVDHELAERSRRTLAGLGVAPEFSESGRGVRILTLDGGGTRGITAVMMLKRIEEISGRRIHELFDLMVGTSTGALIATLASWTRLTMAEAVTYYREACGIIFAPRGTGVLESKYTAPVTEAPQPNTSQGARIFSLAYELEPETFLKITKPLPKVRQALKAAKDASPSSVPLLAPSIASSSNSISSSTSNAAATGNDAEAGSSGSQAGSNNSANSGETQAAHPAGISATWTGPSPWARIGGFFGMISSRSFYDSAALEMVLKNLGDHQATMLDTAANGDLRLIFTATDVGVFPPQSYLLRNYSYRHDSQSKYSGCSSLKMWEAMRCTTAAPAYFDAYTANGHRLSDGGISTNNPTGIAIQEARALWPDKRLDVVLSVGVGLKPTKPITPSMSATFTAILEACTETEQTHALLQELLPKDVYYRLQPVDDVFDFPLDETKIEKLDAARDVLDVWMAEHDDYFHQIAQALTADRKFDDDESPLDAELKRNSSQAWSAHSHHPSKGHLHSSYQDASHHSDDEDIAPSPLRPIHSRTSLMDSYSPLDDLQQWDDDQ
jgi:Leucine-rich repeat (LRR) protein/predicted acylesterase/phospholipase RssA